MSTNDAALAGLDAARRAGWARAYSTEEAALSMLKDVVWRLASTQGPAGEEFILKLVQRWQYTAAHAAGQHERETVHRLAALLTENLPAQLQSCRATYDLYHRPRPADEARPTDTSLSS